MEVFLSSSIIGILLIIIGLYVFTTKSVFRQQKRANAKKEEIEIVDGQIIQPGEKKLISSNSCDASGQKDQEQPSNISTINSQPEERPRIETTVTPSKVQPQPKVIEEIVSTEIEEEGQPKTVKGRLPKIERFWDFLEVAGRGKGTIQAYKYEWNWWKRKATNKGRTPYTLRVQDMEAILKGQDPSTTRRKIAFMRTLAKWYLREGYPRLHEETWKLTIPKLPKRLPKDKGAEEFEKLREKAKKLTDEKDRVGLWIALKLLCGLRISEIQTAKVAAKGMIQVIGKGRKERLVPAPGWVIEGMKKISANGKDGWRQDRKLIWYHLAKIDLRNPHSLRHTCASELLRRKMRIEEIKEFLGHENIATTNIYARAVVPNHAAELLEQ